MRQTLFSVTMFTLVIIIYLMTGSGLSAQSVSTFLNEQDLRQDTNRTPDIVRIPPLTFRHNSLRVSGIYFDSIRNLYWKDKSPDDVYDYCKKLLDMKPELVLYITVYCDSLERNPTKLSQKRADNIKHKLISKGISADRLTAVGKGVTSRRLFDKKAFIQPLRGD